MVMPKNIMCVEEKKGVMEEETERFRRAAAAAELEEEHGNMLAVLPGCLCSVFRESS